MSTAKSMYDLEGEWLDLLDAAAAEVDPETGEPTEDFDARWDALEADIDTKVANTAYVIRRLEAQAKDVKAEATRLKEKAQVLLNGADRLKDRLRDFMRSTEHEKVKTPYISVTLGKPSQRLEIGVVSELPDQYKVRVVEPVRLLIRDALKSGEEVPGAKLVDGPRRLTIR